MPFDQIFMIAVFLVMAVRVAIATPLTLTLSPQAGRGHSREDPLPTARGEGGAERRVRGLDPGFCFALSPLAVILQTHFFARDQRHFGWPPLLIALLMPIAMRVLAPRRAERFLRVALAWVIYPIFCYAYLSAGSLFSAEGEPRAAIFEDAQHIVPAHEMMRGEHAYRDIIPPHGFVQDALLDYLLMWRGDGTLGQLLKSRGTISALNSMATYAVGVAATGSPEAGLVSFFLAVTTGGGGGTFRFLPALVTLAITLQAVRRRHPRLLAWAGACAVFAFMTSLDFGLYAGLTLLFAVTRFPGRRWRALRDAAIGGAIVAVIFAIGFAVAGILSDFVRVTFTEVATLGPAYALSVFDPPAGLEASRVVPELLAYFVEQTSYLYLIWVAALIFLVVALTMRMRISERRRARLDTLVVLAAFVVVCGIAYAERHHLYFKTVVPALLIATVVTMMHARLPAVRLGGWAVALLVLILARPTVHLSITTMLRHSRGPIDPTVHEIVDIVRARGALFPARDAAMIASVNRYVPLHVPPGATFFDFTNRGLLYFLFDRDCPIRQIEVAFYESEDRQREVIARIEQNPNIRAALVPPSADSPDVDGVPNAVRAPLVWQYLQQHFTPDFQEGDVVFWRRVEFPQ